ncbi:MAG: hypothetical protein AB1582_00455 [Pseudomonadota bacterium]
MRRWLDFVGGLDAVVTAASMLLPASPKGTRRSVAAAVAEADRGERIREVLRLELEIAADCRSRTGDLAAAAVLKRLAATTVQADLSTLLSYARLLDDVGDLQAGSDELREIGAGWFPASASEYVARLVEVRGFSRQPDRRPGSKPPECTPTELRITVRSGGRSRP